MENNSIILIGGGGHCKSCIEVIESTDKYKIKGIIDLEQNLGNEILGYPIIGTDHDLPSFSKKNYSFLITLGTIGNPARRIELFNLLISLGCTLPVIKASTACISKYAIIGTGTIVMHNAMINASATIGNNCIINTKALIEHDAIIGDDCHISTGAIINGGTKIGSGCFVGSGAVTKQYTCIPDGSFIKASSIVK